MENPEKPIELQVRVFTLIDDFGLDRDKYRYLSWRKKLAMRIANNLNQTELSIEGLYMAVTCERAANVSGKVDDWKLIWRLVRKSKKPKAKDVNSNDEALSLFEDMLNALGEEGAADCTINTLKKISRTYGAPVIYRALGEFKEDEKHGIVIRSKPAYLVAKIKSVANEREKLAKGSRAAALF